MISVLLVDDEPALLDITQIFLEKTGLFTVDICPSGLQALSILSEKRYDVVVSDYEMPGMNGIQLLKELKSRGDLTPLIIFTGRGPEQVVIDALNNGAIYYLQKGCDPKAQFAELSHKCRLSVQQRRSEIALKESEEKYRALVEHALEGILILDLQGTILLANNAAAQTVEADTSASLAGRNVMEFIAPESRDAVLKDFVEVAHGHDAYVAEYDAVTIAGRRIQVESIGKVISFESKPAILLSIRVSALRKSAEKEPCCNEALFRTFVETAEYGAFVIQGDRIRYANPCLITMTGYSPEEIQEIVAWDFVHPDFRDEFKEKIHALKTAGKKIPDPFEVILVAKGQNECHVRLGINAVECDAEPLVLVTALDITVQRKAESRLEQVNQKLHLLNEVTHHDLLNNFTALFGYFEIIRQNTTDENNLEFMKKQEIILSAIKEQIVFTGYYQDIGNQEPRFYHLAKTIREAASTLPLDQVKLNLDLGQTEIMADPLLIRVFYNLMENALRHGENVTEIRYHCEKRPDGFLIIYEDNGIGIPAKYKDRVFSKGIGTNSGLGLFLIKEILAITNITIHENGDPGKGTRFELLVPEGMFRYHDS